MAYFGSALLLVLLHCPTFEVYASTPPDVYTFEYYADSSCSTLEYTHYIKAVAGSVIDCYYHTDADGDAASPASSFILTCGDVPEFFSYSTGSCTGSAITSATEPWYAAFICGSKGVQSTLGEEGPGSIAAGTLAFASLSQPGSVFTSKHSSSCTKAYLPCTSDDSCMPRRRSMH
jgi:hypothetical protein